MSNIAFVKNDTQKTTVEVGGCLSGASSDLYTLQIPVGSDLHINFKNLVSVNAVGIKKMGEWLRIQLVGAIVLHHCPRALVSHLNFIKGVLPTKVEIQSFYVPYYSSTTELERDVLFVRGTHFRKEANSIVLAEPDVIDEAGDPMSLDVFGIKYFCFLEEYSI